MIEHIIETATCVNFEECKRFAGWNIHVIFVMVSRPYIRHGSVQNMPLNKNALML